ncbi:uncharacterized protein FTOL_09500 [Fusarium torulosum]|uniref:DUF6546 domain-containing protein n=1 Tax=Fusarium torulosum TaxID=33205 RepID=A0AAE8MFM7_9HYPO|nr:uncharacterized protein FTOL_09500 [Fusarium torulosum]
MPRFYSLPPEIQTMILGFTSTSPSIAPYAAVNKHWRSFFEAKTFKSLILHQDDISEFSRIVKGYRRNYIKHLWLRISLPEYPAPLFKVEEDPKVLWDADCAFTESVHDLWHVLSKWDAPRHERYGLTFELSVHSPSDWATYIKDDCSTERDVDLYKQYLTTGSTEPYKNSEDVHSAYENLSHAIGSIGIPTQIQEAYWHPTKHSLLGWKPLCFAFKKASHDDDSAYFSEEESDDYDDLEPQLPAVPVITKMLIRRQQFRWISPEVLEAMTETLPNIQEISIERWRCLEAADEKDWCRSANVTFGMGLPSSLKTLSLYGETSGLFHTWTSKDVKAVSLAKSLRQYTKHLESLSVSHLIDAKEFLRPFWSAKSDTASLPKWEHLKTLSLTSEILNTDSGKDINELLCAAARAARKMPNLQVLELWNGKSLQAGVFRYQVIDSIGEIKWLGTGADYLDAQVLQEWRQTSKLHGQLDLRESASKLKPEEISHTGVVLRYLETKERVLHPVSGYRASCEL